MKTSVITIIIAIVLILIVGGIFVFSSSDNSYTSTTNNNPTTNPSSGSQTPSTKSVEIANFAFSSPTLTINVGDTVTWANQDSVKHTVTSDSGTELSSSTLANGQTYSHTFNTAGTFAYHCIPHPYMKAKVIVQ